MQLNFLLLVLVAIAHSSHTHQDEYVKISEYPYVTQRKVCYPDVGCFDTEYPYFYLPGRPVPPPQDPADFRPFVRYAPKDPFTNAHWEIPLSGAVNVSKIFEKKKYTQDVSIEQSNSITYVMGCFEDDYDMIFKFGKQINLGSRLKGPAFIFGTHRKAESEMQNISNLRAFGVLIARFIKNIQVQHGKLSSEQSWLIGVDCGAHLAGYVGERVQIKRITGLDPSSYLFENEDPLVRLDRGDALYVDVMHTDARPNIRENHGYIQPIGHVDFYMNGGFHQPNCTNQFAPENDNFKHCNHYTAMDYFRRAMALGACKMWGHSISVQNYVQSLSNDDKTFGVRRNLVSMRKLCTLKTCVPVGDDSDRSPLRGIMVVTTNGLECSITDKVSPKFKYAGDYMLWLTSKWLYTLIPLEKYVAPPVKILPFVPHICFPYYFLGCFDMSPPWTVLRSRPISQPESPKLQRIEAWFYSRDDMNKKYTVALHPRIPDDPDVPFNASRMTFLLIHGFYNSGDEPWLGTMKEALLNATDCNVVVCNWGGGSVTLDYLQAAGNLRLASRVYSNMLQFFVDQKGMNVTRVHLIGHSLGAHIAGLIAKSIPGIFQVTALDPAQPWFLSAEDSVRVTKHDANFVMGVHSDIPPFIPDLGFGLAPEVGHIDFYINGGFKQPKCSQPHNVEAMVAPNLTNIVDLVKPVSQLFVKIVLCPHQSAVEIFTEAVATRHCIFWGQAIKMSNMIAAALRSQDGSKISPVEFKAATDSDCTPTTCSPLGLDTYFWPARGSFVILTKNFPPYCIFSNHVKSLQIARTGIHFSVPDALKSLKSSRSDTWYHFMKAEPYKFLKLAVAYFLNKTLPVPFTLYASFVGVVMSFMLPIQVGFHYGYKVLLQVYGVVRAWFVEYIARLQAKIRKSSTTLARFTCQKILNLKAFDALYCQYKLRVAIEKVAENLFFFL